jgi:hypothetical protein
MDIETLRLRVSGEEINALLGEHLPEETGVQNLQVLPTAEGIQMTGRYTGMLLPLSFETLWVLGVAEGRLRAQLTQVRVAGFPATKLRGVLLGVLAENIADVAGLMVQDDQVHFDVNVFLEDQAVPLRLTPSAIHCQPGWIILEASS